MAQGGPVSDKPWGFSSARRGRRGLLGPSGQAAAGPTPPSHPSALWLSEPESWAFPFSLRASWSHQAHLASSLLTR